MDRKASALMLLFLLTGCGLFNDREPDWPKVQTQANAWRIEVNGMVDAIAPYADVINAVCTDRGSASNECRMLRAAYATARGGTDAAQAAIDVYATTGAETERVEQAVETAQKSIDVVEAAIGRMQEVISGLAPNGSQNRAGADPAPAPQADAGAAPAAGTGQTPADARAGQAAATGSGGAKP